MPDAGRTEKEPKDEFPRLKIDNNIDDIYANVQNFYNTYPFFYDKNKIFWAWDELSFKYSIVDEVDLMSKIDTFFNFY